MFWSYKLWVSGNTQLGKEIVCNILMFVPIGILLSTLTSNKKYILTPFLLSCIIEVLQLYTMHGMFELDDIINNTFGALVGWSIGAKIKKEWIPYIGIISMVAVFLISLFNSQTDFNIPKALVFQIDEIDNGKTIGFCFRPGRDTDGKYSVKLRNIQTNQIESIDFKTGIERPDVNTYFSCEYNYSRSGFEATVPVIGKYEFIICYNSLLKIPTGVYISDSKIQFADYYIVPNINEDFVRDGILRIYQPDEHFWIYQFRDALYWIFEDDFEFEDGENTFIQYQLWTTKKNKLPKRRLDKERYWDNRSDYLEDNEIVGNWVGYRVMKRKIPSDYPVTAILTGRYKSGEWIWKEYFRPVYHF